jgi:hypothetical protein
LDKVLHNNSLIIGFLVLSIVLGVLHRRLSSSGSILALIYCLPFTIMHELSHFMVALITGGRPSSFSIWPRRTVNGWLLGSVSAVPTLLSAAPTALAPLGWLIAGYYVMKYWDVRPQWLPEYYILVILYACSAACMPSWQDINVAIKHPFSLALWGGGGYLAVMLWTKLAVMG